MKIRSIIFRLLEWLGFSEKSYRIQRVPELPDNPRPFVIYAIGNPDAWLAALVCPCGCGHLDNAGIVLPNLRNQLIEYVGGPLHTVWSANRT